MAQQESINILEFQQRFATDDTCCDHLFKIRWPEGPTCAKCCGRNFYKMNRPKGRGIKPQKGYALKKQ